MGGGAPCEPTGIHISCQTVSEDIFLQLGYLFEMVCGRICTPATVKPFTPQNTRKTLRKLKPPSVGGPSLQLPYGGQLTG